jgi:hypothetical protein
MNLRFNRSKSTSMIRKLTAIFIFFPLMMMGQSNDTIPHYGYILLDSVVISAVKKGLDIQDLLDIMQYDSTLYIAFNQLHFTNYIYENDLKALNSKSKVEASKTETIEQSYADKCRYQTIIAQKIEGNFNNKKGEERYYTAELFNRTLYNANRVCNEKPKTNWKAYLYQDKTGGHLEAIKKVIFNPGNPVNLPLIGDKFALFDKSMQPFYDYSIDRKMVNNEECFVFTIIVKPEFATTRKDVVVRKLVTAFRKSDFQIIQRDYEMLYKGAAVKLDIKMKIDLAQQSAQTLPTRIEYDGYFNIPLKKPERITFVTNFEYE